MASSSLWSTSLSGLELEEFGGSSSACGNNLGQLVDLKIFRNWLCWKDYWLCNKLLMVHSTSPFLFCFVDIHQQCTKVNLMLLVIIFASWVSICYNHLLFFLFFLIFSFLVFWGGFIIIAHDSDGLLCWLWMCKFSSNVATQFCSMIGDGNLAITY